jgi:transcriptional regulator with XRE-family HTH domain
MGAMPTPRRPDLHASARQANHEQLARLGSEVRASRRRRRLTQAALGARAGVVQSTVSQVERGLGGTLSVDVWQRLFASLGRRLLLDAARDPMAEPADAGHLRVQELVLRLGRGRGVRGDFELPTRPSDPSRSADVSLRDDRTRRLILVECWNSIGDVGAAARSTSRKLAEAAELAVALGGERPYAVAGCWVVRATARNRQLVASYPEVFAARLPGSSERWVRALDAGDAPPPEPGLVWCDINATRLFAWRRR